MKKEEQHYPSQFEIDAIAHFVEAVRELRKSPFFIEEHRSLSISNWGSKEGPRGQFPDPQIIRAALVPFRRVWNQNEFCYYIKVANILRRYIPACRDIITLLLFKDTLI